MASKPPKEGDGSEEFIEQPPIWLNASSDVPTVFADALIHISVANGVARLSFTQQLAEPKNAPSGDQGFRTKYVINVALPTVQLANTLAYLQKTIEDYKASGILPPEEA